MFPCGNLNKGQCFHDLKVGVGLKTANSWLPEWAKPFPEKGFEDVETIGKGPSGKTLPVQTILGGEGSVSSGHQPNDRSCREAPPPPGQHSAGMCFKAWFPPSGWKLT